MKKTASEPFFDSSAVCCNVVTHRGLTVCFDSPMLSMSKAEGTAKAVPFELLVTHRGIEPRSTPSESATLSVELMSRIYLGCGFPFAALLVYILFWKK